MLDTTANGVTYRGGENQSVFPIPFPFLESSHIRARIRDADGVSRALTAGTDYSINQISDGNGEFILLGEPLRTGFELTISRLVPITQDILFHNQGPNSPKAIEAAADKLTMIAQQIDSRLDGYIPVPDGKTAEEAAADIANGVSGVSEVRRDLAAVKVGLSAKAPLHHGHAISEVDGLERALAGKAELSLLQTKADASQLQNKADKSHSHAISEVRELTAALTRKVDTDDPRLDKKGAPEIHAAAHFTGGEDPIRPEDIGAVAPPPNDGRSYLAVRGGWVAYIPPTIGDDEEKEGIGTLDHSQLLNRDAADQHPQTAIQSLTTDLEAIRKNIAALDQDGDDLTRALADGLAAKADKTELPTLASSSTSGLMSAEDKRKIDSYPATVPSLPSGGASGDFLQYSSTGAASWCGPVEAAGCLPLMTASQKGVARLAANGGLALDSGGALGIKADNLLSKSNIEGRIAAHDTRIGSLETTMKSVTPLTTRVGTLETSLLAVDGKVSSLTTSVNGLGTLSRKADAPSDGKLYLRKDGAWVEYVEPAGGGGSGGGDGGILGEIRLLPFRQVYLPKGWYLCNGDRYLTTSVQGQVLNSFRTAFKIDWGITASNGYISLPNFFNGTDGYFLRPVNNSSRQPGSKQGGAIPNLSGTFGFSNVAGIGMSTSPVTGAFVMTNCTKSFGMQTYGSGLNTAGDLHFDASRLVATDSEVRPQNLGMTPAIYLGV